MNDKVILLVEDNADDEALTRRALAKNNIRNTIVVAHDGVEALDCVFGTGSHEGDPLVPEVILLDLKLPKVDGLEVLRRVRANARTRLVPVIILTSSKEGEGRAQRIWPGGQQLHPEAGGLRSVCGGGTPAGALLVGIERAAPESHAIVSAG